MWFITVKLHNPSASCTKNCGQRDNETTPLLEGVPAQQNWCQISVQLGKRGTTESILNIFWQCENSISVSMFEYFLCDTSSPLQQHAGKNMGTPIPTARPVHPKQHLRLKNKAVLTPTCVHGTKDRATHRNPPSMILVVS